MKKNCLLGFILSAFVFISIKTDTYALATHNDFYEDSSKVETSWFNVKLISEKVWRIDDHGGDFMYLIEGDEKALLIDTGRGIGDLLSLIKTITKLPLVVVNTHGHHDHAAGNFQFEQVYAHENDLNLIKGCNNADYRKYIVKQLLSKSPELSNLILKEVENYLQPEIIHVKEGFTFDLGNRKLEVIETPGHTKGGICLLDSKNKLLFAGDNNNEIVWLFLDGCLPLETYLKELERLKLRNSDFDTILAGHCEPLDKAFIDEQITCIRNILDGTCKGEPYKYLPNIDYALLCKYKRALVAYDPRNLFPNQE